MTTELDDAYDAWKAADAVARGVEERVEAAWERHESARGEPPHFEEMQEALRLRARANEMLTLAIELVMEERALATERDSSRLGLLLE